MKIITLLLLGISFLFANIDINHASVKELTALKGIGMKKAEAIVAYRKEHKCFKDINELVKVKGISTKTLEKNKSNLTAKKCK